MSRRPKGEGSLYQRANGTWAGVVAYRDETDRVRRSTVYAKTQVEARRKLSALHERIAAGAPVSTEKITLADWLEQWIAVTLPASGRRQATIDLYGRLARKHLIPTLGAKQLDRIRPSDIDALVLAKKRETLSSSSVRNIYTVLRGALEAALRDGLLPRNPAAVVRRPPVEHHEARYLTAQQAQQLLDAMRGDRLEPLYRLMLATGLRRGEALGLYWADVDFERQVLKVRRTLTRTSQGLELGAPKTAKSRRTVPLPAAAVSALVAQRRQQAEDRRAAGHAWRTTEFVFTSEVGTALEPRNILHRFQKLASRAGLTGISLHTLRHSAASLLLAAGTHTKVVQEHLGHSSFAITADIYSHVDPVLRREAADKLDQALRWD